MSDETLLIKNKKDKFLELTSHNFEMSPWEKGIF